MADLYILDEFGDAKAGNYSPSFYTKIRALLYTGTRPYKAVPLLEELRVTVLDISFWQVTADFEKMMGEGVGGVIIRGGQNLWEDSQAKSFMDGATVARMPFGSYWFYDSRVSPQAQAAKWRDVLIGYNTELWIWADYEENYNGPYTGWKHFYDFLEECRRLMPERKLGIYTGYYYWIDHSPNPITQAASLSYFGQYPLWLAWYTANPADVIIPKPWTELTFWQYTSSGDGYKYGVASREVDMNKFMGTDFYGTFDLSEDNNGEEPMPDKPVTYYMDLKAGATANVRTGPGQGYAIVRAITGPLTVSIVGEAIDNPNDMYEWYEIVSPVAGFTAKTTNYENFRPATAPSALPDTLYIGTLADGSDVKKYTASEE